VAAGRGQELWERLTAANGTSGHPTASHGPS